MRNLNYTHKIYIFIMLSLTLYILGNISLNIYIQQKNFIEDIKIGLKNLSQTIAYLAIASHNNNDVINKNEQIDLTLADFDNSNKFIPIILDINGEVKYHISDEPKNIYNLEDADGNHYIQYICENIKNQKTQEIITLRKRDSSGQVSKWMLYYHYIPDFNWIIITSTNISSHKLFMNKQIGINILFSIFFLILTMIAIIPLSHKFNKQLSELTNIVVRYSAKEFDVRAKITNKNEIGKLGSLFNQMADKLNDLHNNLHAKIEERTIALQDGNEELQMQNEEIEQQNEEIKAINDEMQALNNELQKSETKIRRLVESLEDKYFFYTQEMDGKYSYMSPSVYKLLGYNQSECESGILSYLTDNPINKFAISTSLKIKNGQKQPPFEVELRDKKNNFKQFEILEVPIFDKDNKVIAVEGLAHEITERKQTELILAKEQYLMNTLMENLPNNIYFKDAESRFIRINKAHAQFFGLNDPAEAVGKTDSDFFTGEHAKQAYEDEQNIIRTGQMLTLEEKETYHDRPDTWVSTIKMPLKDKTGKIIGTFGISRDITEHKLAEEAFRKLSLRQEAILTSVPEIIMEIDKNKIFTWVNQSGIKFFGEDIIGKETSIFFENNQEMSDICQPLIDGVEDLLYSEIWQQRLDGEKRLLAWWCKALKDDDGVVTGVLSSAHDITERKQQELIHKILYNISMDVNSTKDIAEFISFIQNQLSQLLDTSNFFVAFYNKEADMLSVGYIQDEKDKLESWPAGKSLTGYVVKNKKPLFVNKSEILEMNRKGMVDLVGTTAEVWIGIPLIINDVVMGVLVTQNYENENAYSKKDFELLEFISSQISLSIERKKVAHELKTTNIALSTQKEELQTTLESLQDTQSQLIQSEKMAALGQLIAGIAHEINTPLGAINASIGNMSDALDTSISNLPELLRKMDEKDLFLYLKLMSMVDFDTTEENSKEKRRLKKQVIKLLEENNIREADKIGEMFMYMKVYKHLDQLIPLLNRENTLMVLSNARNIISLRKNTKNINLAVTKASKVVFALKKFAHRDHIGEKTETDIIDGIETVLTLYYNQIKQGVEVIRNFKSIPLIKCHPDELNQVWTNLIHNSLQAMDNKGTLTVTVEQEGDGVVVKVSDTGSGIPEELREKIFQAFFTTKKAGEGSGLGLDIVKKIIDKHGGKIDFVSKVGFGTTFTIWLPFSN